LVGGNFPAKKIFLRAIGSGYFCALVALLHVQKSGVFFFGDASHRGYLGWRRLFEGDFCSVSLGAPGLSAKVEGFCSEAVCLVPFFSRNRKQWGCKSRGLCAFWQSTLGVEVVGISGFQRTVGGVDYSDFW